MRVLLYPTLLLLAGAISAVPQQPAAAKKGQPPRSGSAATQPVAAAALNSCRQHQRSGQLTEARGCYEALVTSERDSWSRGEALWGAGRLKDANDAFKQGWKAYGKSPDFFVRWGRLLLEGNSKEDAAASFGDALKIKEDYPPALLGMAMAAQDDFEAKAVELAEKAASLDPKLTEARELLAALALEDSNPAKAIEWADKALSIDSESLDAMAIRATIDLLEDRNDTPWLGKIAAINPKYGEAYAIAGRFFVINRRYEEGIGFYRKALELNPSLWTARSELGINLMRLGADDEARKHLELSYKNGLKNAQTTNTLTLLDSYRKFVTIEQDGFRIKLHKNEAEILRPYVEDELRRALRTFEKKYGFKLQRPVQLEVYPEHEDFAVRTMGLPGLGALGVTFGYVVAMDSPSARKPGSFHWASTLWHELSHVFVLAATKHRVPRWFTEGMAVHEETAASPEWGDRLDPSAIQAIQKKLLLPVAQFDRGFIRPTYPSQVPVSYFQAGKICDYITEKWGYAKLIEMMHAFGKHKSTPEVFQEVLGLATTDFDKQFLDWLHAQTKTQVENYSEWRKRVAALSRTVQAKNWEEAIKEGTAIRDLYPDYVEAGSVYQMLADAYAAKGSKKEETEQLLLYARQGGRDPALLKRLAVGLEEQGKKKEAAEALDRINFIYPGKDEELHRRLGDLHIALGNTTAAIREYRALVASNPVDPAAAQFQLARAYRANQQLDQAREHVLLALEQAPGYRPAQQLLLELSGGSRKQ